MERFISIVGALVIISLLNALFQKLYGHKVQINSENDDVSTNDLEPALNSETNMNIENEIMEKPQYNTQQLMVSTLSQIGCQPTVNDDNSVTVNYQGEIFHIDFGGPYAQIWDFGWAVINEQDPELPKIKDAVNAANFNFGPTVVMSNPDDKGTMYVHSRLGIVLVPGIPEAENYVRSSLDMFFRAKEAVRQNFQQINVEQQKERESRRPVGFKPAADSSGNVE